MGIPALTFYCELNTQALSRLFENRFVLDDLKTLKARLSLAIQDLSHERAQLVKKLNKVGIPVVAWLLLPEDKGYWFNADNYEQAFLQYEAFKQWSRQNKLVWAGIGLDIEPDILTLRKMQTQKLRVFTEAFKGIRGKKELRQAQENYQQMVAQMHKDGWRVESYHLPFIADERKAHSTILQRVTGLVDFSVDQEILMLYTSFVRPCGPNMLWQYAGEAGSIGIGSTGGGVDVEGVIDKPPLSWEEFSNDLRLAYQTGKPVHIFCLEGCVAQGFLEKLITFDWGIEPRIPDVKAVKAARGGFQATLWALERPWVILGAFLGVIGGVWLARKRKR